MQILQKPFFWGFVSYKSMNLNEIMKKYTKNTTGFVYFAFKLRFIPTYGGLVNGPQ
jgi:hypothetical protein